jgi:hypothetical protein
MQILLLPDGRKQLSRSSCTGTSRVESKRKRWPWIVTLVLPFWWALEGVDVYIILEHGEGGPPAAEAWEMIIAEARKSVTQTRSQTGEDA